MKFNFEELRKGPTPHEGMQVIKTPEEILEQLNVSQERYEQALKKFHAGNMDDLDYLEQMQENLRGYITKFDVEFGTLTPETAEIKTQVMGRLYELSEALEKVTH